MPIQDAGDTALEQALLAARRWWWILALSVVIASSAAVALSLRQPVQFTASTSILFRDPGFDRMLFANASASPSTDADPTREAATNLYLVSLPVVASRTAAALHVSTSLVRSEVGWSGVGQADVAQISATDQSPVRAAQIANTYAN